MKLRQAMLTGLVAWLLAASAHGQTTRPASPGGEGHHEEKVLPKVELPADLSLDKALEFLGALDPSFQAVVVRVPGVPGGYPKVPYINVKNVTARQVAELLAKALPEVSIDGISGTRGLLIFRVRRYIPPEGEDVQVGIYRLKEVIDANHAAAAPPRPGQPPPSPAEQRKLALSRVLSLVNNVMGTLGPGAVGAPELRVHEETETLIVKGTQSQQGTVITALKALAPPATPTQVTELKLQVEFLRKELDNKQYQLDRLQTENQQLVRELARSKATTPGPMPMPGPAAPPGGPPPAPPSPKP